LIVWRLSLYAGNSERLLKRRPFENSGKQDRPLQREEGAIRALFFTKKSCDRITVGWVRGLRAGLRSCARFRTKRGLAGWLPPLFALAGRIRAGPWCLPAGQRRRGRPPA